MAVVCVTIFDSAGRPFIHVTASETLFGAVSQAIDWFNDPFWKGPKPMRETIFDVSVVGREGRWRVAAETVEKWRHERVSVEAGSSGSCSRALSR